MMQHAAIALLVVLESKLRELIQILLILLQQQQQQQLKFKSSLLLSITSGLGGPGTALASCPCQPWLCVSCDNTGGGARMAIPVAKGTLPPLPGSISG